MNTKGNPWTGKNNKSHVPIGSYYYAIEADDSKPLTGTVTIAFVKIQLKLYIGLLHTIMRTLFITIILIFTLHTFSKGSTATFV